MWWILINNSIWNMKSISYWVARGCYLRARACTRTVTHSGREDTRLHKHGNLLSIGAWLKGFHCSLAPVVSNYDLRTVWPYPYTHNISRKWNEIKQFPQTYSNKLSFRLSRSFLGRKMRPYFHSLMNYFHKRPIYYTPVGYWDNLNAKTTNRIVFFWGTIQF